jgi:16S rRNA C1402 N4-methylase RsmH
VEASTIMTDHFLLAHEGKIQRPSFTMVTQNPILPSEKEIQENVRSRSAMLRVAQRTENLPTHKLSQNTS